MITPSSQGPCICLEGASDPNCPRHAYEQDWIGQFYFKDHLREYSNRYVYEWIQRHYGRYMGNRLLTITHQMLILNDFSGATLPRDLDRILQTIRHARACIKHQHEPTGVPS